ncbi:uncharacterized protein LOC135496134 [Lineus longissimus]|uniref:uncharacterized protein LOC135496134 n=1 Tax=Lineus longissimus TaxID=88925 RepID=UPI00315CD76D
MLKELKNLIQKGSGWKFLEVTKIELHTVKYQPLSGSSYIPLPKQIQRKKAVINVQNTDQLCFRYSVEAALLNIPKNTERVANYNRPEFDHMFKGLDYPVTLKDIDKFEKNNPGLGVNVFTFIPRQVVFKKGEETTIYPARVSERILAEDKYINLLHYKEDDTSENESMEAVKDNANYHYAWIKNFSRLVSASHSKHDGRSKLMQSSLANLAKNLPNQQMKNLATKFNGEHFDLVTRKGVDPYEWVDSHEKFQSQQLPSIEEFYSTFNNTKISQEEYLHAQHVWDKFNCQTFQEYHKLYLETDVLLLADIIENFRQTCMNIYNLDPAFFFTSPGLSWQAMLKMTKVEIELLTDVDMYNFFELGIRGGVCQASHRYGKANNPLLKDYDENQPTSYITYVDANNLYGVAMGQDLPVRNFKWMSQTDFNKWQDIPCTLEVDLEYPKHLHNLHNDYPLAPEHKNDKLIPNLQDKKNYIVHHKILKFYLCQGLKLTKIHRGVSYEESSFLKEYIDFNTSQRANAKNDFEKDFFKLMNNAIFGKTMESVRRRKDITLATTADQLRKLVNSNNYTSHKIFCKDVVMVERQKAEVYLNKPIFMGQAILDLSKEHMYDFHYSHMMKKYGHKAQLLYTDTDSLVYNIQTDDIYKDMQKDAHLYDFSNFPKDHELFSDVN